MPAPIASTLVTLTKRVCLTCAGIGEEIDTDGSFTGLPGALIPCGDCVPGSFHGPDDERCACWLSTWRHNGGYTGWAPIPVGHFEDGSPMYTACLVHNTAVRAALGLALASKVVAA